MSKAATNHVARNLQKDHPDNPFQRVHESMRYDSLEIFTADCKSWLGDHSALKSSTINSADYAELYRDFGAMNEHKAVTEPGKPVYHTKTGVVVGWLSGGRFIPAEEA
ncbi:hypothetical protein ACFWNC_14490 [Streptomyces sp. NPDC058369]|uniref:hypothetical protein n=1 Tax=Streptomyces sp. NPDC058369 TaxID=3346462 RepID=UPI00365D85CC